MEKRRIACGLFVALLFQLMGSVVYAQTLTFDPGFDPNRVLEDDDIFNVNAMSYSTMVQFLREKGTLADTILPDTDGVPKKIPEILWRVATSYKINPKYLLALMQKEQSLVEDLSPSQKQFDWATGYGVCDSCSKDDPSIQEFKGFASQIEWAAKQHREKYLLQLLGKGTTRAGDAPGKQMAIDGLSVTPTNNATAMLYSYTPHINGNLNLWRIWQRWFSLMFPDGTIVQGKASKKTYIIRLGQKRKFASRTVTASLVDLNKVVMVSDTELEAYPDGPVIQFPKYALLRDSQKQIWLLTGESRRQIVNMKAFHKFDFNEDEIIDLDTDSDLDQYPAGEPITTKTEFPQGVVFQNSVDKTYWYTEGSTRQLLPDKVFLTLYFQGRVIRTLSPKKLAAYTIGNIYQLHDGELVRNKSTPSVYVVENGALKPIPSADVFQQLGWKWKNVVTVSDKTLAGYTVGDAVALHTL